MEIWNIQKVCGWSILQNSYETGVQINAGKLFSISNSEVAF